MNLDEIYESILPYLSDPKCVKEFLDGLKDKEEKELIEEINCKISESTSSFKTDLKILLNALQKRD
jgi:hypothetical protein